MKKYIWMGAVLLCVALLLFAAANIYAKWHRDQYFGTVIRVSPSEILLQDTRVGERSIHITSGTRIWRGPETVPTLPNEGDRIIVFGEEREGIVEATLIRVVTDDWDMHSKQGGY